MKTKREILFKMVEELSLRLNREDFQGLQFKMNTDDNNLRYTIALRCNRIPLDEIHYIVKIAFDYIGKYTDMIERISVNKAYAPGLTGRKRYVRDSRTVYITMRPPEKLFKAIWANGLHAYTSYAFTPVLLEKLEEEI
jgi:hypothetical protein